MPTAILTSKGRITVPQAVRHTLGLHAGSRIDFVAVAGGFKVVPSPTQGYNLKGRFAGRNDRSAPIESMDEALAAEASSRHGQRA